MRIVAWNNRRRSLEETAALLKSLHADILVLSETAQPNAANPLGAHWFGDKNPGLAVIARAGLDLAPHSANVGAPQITAGFEVSGDLRFNLVAAWPVKIPPAVSYHKVLMATLEHFAEMIGAGPAFLVGDLNSNARVIEQRSTHPIFVERAHSLGLVSAYHHQTRESHGEETTMTYVHGSGDEFHLDYCFVPLSLADQSTIRVLRDDDWSTRSDHFPVVLDVPDAALKNTSP